MQPVPRPVAVLITAAGTSARFGSGKKELVSLGSHSVLEAAILPFLKLPGLVALVVTAPEGREAELEAAISEATKKSLGTLGSGRFAIVAGGPSRRDSVRLGLEAIEGILASLEKAASTHKSEETIVLVHDGARPWVSADLAERVVLATAKSGAAVPVIPLVDTPKSLSPEGIVLAHPSRSSLGSAQTPQGFLFAPLLSAHRKALEAHVDCTDDAELWDHFIGPVAWVAGETENRKLTFARDLEKARPEAGGAKGPAFRIGQGWDLHVLVPGRKLMLGGVEIPSDKGELAHSDGDVLLHAIIDALLGAASLGDIGQHFPPSDPQWKNADSRLLARKAMELVRAAGWQILNLDCTVILEVPKLGPHKDAIRLAIASCLDIEATRVSVKAKTKEGVDATGEGRAIESLAIAALGPLA